MIEFIIQYWVQFLFGLIIAGGSFLMKKGWNNYKKKKEREQEEFFNKIEEKLSSLYQRTKDDDIVIKEEVEAIKKGLLSVQGAKFRAECNRLLDKNHVITTNEYTQLVEDHDAYNGLNGNHKGDSLFELVKEKVKNQSK